MSVTLAQLEGYSFPVEEGCGDPADISEVVEVSEDECNPSSTPRKLVPASMQPFLRRRDAVVGETVPPDPTYWFSPSRYISPKDPALLDVMRKDFLDVHPWFSGYAPFIKKLFEEAFEFRAFEYQDLVSQPGDDYGFCYVLKGSVEITPCEEEPAEARSPRASSWLHQRVRVKCRQGDDFGREGLLHFLCGPRLSYYAKALVSSTVLMIKRETFKKIMMVNYLERHDFIGRTINYVRVFDAFSDAEKSRIAGAVEVVVFKKGDTLLRAGETPQYLHVIQEGTVEVKKSLPSGLHAQVKLLVPSECVGDAEIFSWETKSLYDYIANEEVKTLRLPQDFLYEFHGNPLLQHLFGKINVKEVQGRKALADEMRRKDEYSVVDFSESEEDVVEMMMKSKKQKEKTPRDVPCDDLPVTETDEEDDTLDSDDEERYITPVNMKSDEVTNFLLTHFFSRRGYSKSEATPRGIALTVFASPRRVAHGVVLFSAEPATLEGQSEAVARSRRLRRRKDHPAFDNNEQYLYVVYKGTVELLDRDGDRIALIEAGGSVGEHRLLKRVSAACEVTARVASPEGCELIRLPRKIYRATLMPSYVQEYTSFKQLFAFLPFSSGFPEPYLLVLHQHVALKDIGVASVLIAEGVTPREVYILCDGKVQIRSSVNKELHYAQPGDVLGGLEVLDSVQSRAAYITEGRVHVLCIPAVQFLSIFRLGTAFVDHLRHTARFRKLYGPGFTGSEVAQ